MMKTKYIWFFTVTLVITACTKEETGGDQGEKPVNEFSIQISPMVYPSGSVSRSLQEELPAGLSVTYEKGNIEDEISTRVGETSLVDEFSIDFMDIFNVRNRLDNYEMRRAFLQKIDGDKLEGPFVGGQIGDPYYYYKTYFIPMEFPLDYEPYTHEALIIANLNKQIVDTDKDHILKNYAKNACFNDQSAIVPDGKFFFIGNNMSSTGMSLERVQAKIDVRVTVRNDQNSDMDKLTLTSIRLRNAPRTFTMPSFGRNPVYFDENGPDEYQPITEVEKDLYYMDYEPISGSDIGRNGSSDRFVWYVLPNYNFSDQGSNTVGWYPGPEKNKTIENAPKSYQPLHIELAGKYKEKDIIFRICVGEDNNEYNVYSNVCYKININITGQLRDNDPRIEYDW